MLLLPADIDHTQTSAKTIWTSLHECGLYLLIVSDCAPVIIKSRLGQSACLLPKPANWSWDHRFQWLWWWQLLRTTFFEHDNLEMCERLIWTCMMYSIHYDCSNVGKYHLSEWWVGVQGTMCSHVDSYGSGIMDVTQQTNYQKCVFDRSAMCTRVLTTKDYQHSTVSLLDTWSNIHQTFNNKRIKTRSNVDAGYRFCARRSLSRSRFNMATVTVSATW